MNWQHKVRKERQLYRKRVKRLAIKMQRAGVLDSRDVILRQASWGKRFRAVNSLSHGEVTR
jgi:transposase